MLQWKKSLALPVTMVAIALGFLISLQIQTQKNVSALEQINNDRLTATKSILENSLAQKKQLQAEHDKLTAELDQARTQGTADPNVLAELVQVRIMDGTQAVQGPGIHITIDDRPGKNKALFPLREESLQEIVNILRFAGAEAISVNGQRIVSNTSIVSSGSTIMVNQVPIARTEGVPYEIEAIGDQDTLYDYFSKLEAASLRESGMTVSITRKTVQVPSYKGGYDFTIAKRADNL